MYASILLCYDGSREGRLALREGARLAQITGSAVTLLAIVETAVFTRGADASALSHQQSDVEAILDEGRRRLTVMGLSPRVRIETGDPVACITRVASETGADLVVVGHHRHGFWTRWLSRSVAAELADALGCSLLLAQKVVEDSELFSNA